MPELPVWSWEYERKKGWFAPCETKYRSTSVATIKICGKLHWRY